MLTAICCRDHVALKAQSSFLSDKKTSQITKDAHESRLQETATRMQAYKINLKKNFAN